MDLRKLLAIGTGVGIEVRKQDLAVTLARVRPRGVVVLGSTVVPGFRERPASDWGAEYAQFLRQHGGSHLAATVVLPRRDVIVRQVLLPGVEDRDLDSAIRFQVDSLHPWGEEEVVFGFERVSPQGAVLIGLVRRTALTEHIERFNEAGIAVASLTFSATLLHAAARLYGAPPASGFLTIDSTEDGEVEAYGESPAKPVLSAIFDLPPERAAALAAAELRLAADTEPLRLDQVLPAPAATPAGALSYAAALAGACPRLAPAANLLPVENRASSSRARYIPTAALATILLLITGATFAYSLYGERRYLAMLEQEIARLEPLSRKATAADKAQEHALNRARLLDDFRRRTQADLDVLNELTRLMASPAWSSQLHITRDAVILAGETPEAAPLLKLLDGSPYFQRSAFSTAIVRAEKNELFRIRTEREPR